MSRHVHTRSICHVYEFEWSRKEEAIRFSADLREFFRVPHVISLDTDLAFRCGQMKRASFWSVTACTSLK
jgi:hypothetical protein